MKKLPGIVFLGLTVFVVGCGTPADNATQSPSPSRGQAAPTAESLLALDRQATEAYLKGDAKFFQSTLQEKFVMYDHGRRLNKPDTIQMVAGTKCDVKDWKLEDPRLGRIDADTYALSYQGTFAGSCTGPEGKAMKVPSPIRAATVWVRYGDTWQAVFHGENQLIDPKAPPAKTQAKKQGSKPAGAKSEGPGQTDAATASLMAAEKNAWEAWMAKDAKRIEDLTAPELTFQNIFGTYFGTRAEAVKDWTGPHCDVSKVSVYDGAGAMLSPTVGMLTRTGMAEGTCGGQRIASVPIYGVSVFVKQGDAWKLAFSLNQL